MDEYYHDDDIADLLGISVAGLRNKVDAGDALPPHTKLPRIRARLWPKKETHDWIRQFLIKQAAEAGRLTGNRRGRPPKQQRGQR